jgi:hypothetical protein
MGGYGSGGYGSGPYGGSGGGGGGTTPNVSSGGSAGMSTASNPAVSYRNIVNGEPQWGQGQGNFVTGIEAVALLIQTRLLLFLGEWFLNLQDGLPLWQILGQNADVSVINALIQQRINATPYVVSSSNVGSQFNQSTGQFSYSAQVQTVFGPLSVTNVPQGPN